MYRISEAGLQHLRRIAEQLGTGDWLGSRQVALAQEMSAILNEAEKHQEKADERPPGS